MQPVVVLIYMLCGLPTFVSVAGPEIGFAAPVPVIMQNTELLEELKGATEAEGAIVERIPIKEAFNLPYLQCT